MEWKILKRGYIVVKNYIITETKITEKKGSEDIEWVRVIKSVYLRMKEQRYEDFEIEYMERAKFFLYGEIAIRFDIPINQVEEFVNDTVKKYLEEF